MCEILQDQTQVCVKFRILVVSIKPKRTSPLIIMRRSFYIDLEPQTGLFVQLIQNGQHIGNRVQFDAGPLIADQIRRGDFQFLCHGIDNSNGRFDFSAFVLLDCAQGFA